MLKWSGTGIYQYIPIYFDCVWNLWISSIWRIVISINQQNILHKQGHRDTATPVERFLLWNIPVVRGEIALLRNPPSRQNQQEMRPIRTKNYWSRSRKSAIQMWLTSGWHLTSKAIKYVSNHPCMHARKAGCWMAIELQLVRVRNLWVRILLCLSSSRQGLTSHLHISATFAGLWGWWLLEVWPDFQQQTLCGAELVEYPPNPPQAWWLNNIPTGARCCLQGRWLHGTRRRFGGSSGQRSPWRMGLNSVVG